MDVIRDDIIVMVCPTNSNPINNFSLTKMSLPRIFMIISQNLQQQGRCKEKNTRRTNKVDQLLFAKRLVLGNLG